MKPSRIHYILAHSIAIPAWGGALLAACIAGWNCYPEMVFASRSYFFWFVAAVLIVIPLGSMLGALVFAPFISITAGRMNGAPFREGDSVRVLIGPYKDHTGRIYEIWNSRNQVRVDLGEQPRKEVNDVFFYCEVYREKRAPDTD